MKIINRIENVITALRESRLFNADFRIFLAVLLFIIFALFKSLTAHVVEIHIPNKEEIANEHKEEKDDLEKATERLEDLNKEIDKELEKQEKEKDESVFCNETIN